MKSCSPNAVVCLGGIFAHIPQLSLDLFIYLDVFVPIYGFITQDSLERGMRGHRSDLNPGPVW